MRHHLQAQYPETAHKVKFYIGDVRNRESVNIAMRGVDYVFAAAALKQAPSCEFFPMESADELSGLVADIFDNRQKYLDYGIKAKAFYDDCRKPVDMANGLWKAIQYVLKK